MIATSIIELFPRQILDEIKLSSKNYRTLITIIINIIAFFINMFMWNFAFDFKR